ncbi:hypothetical protein DFA_05880 [Cavenderia fasciculata]|uniref:MACPF domain-containing protein n=1 Tax=Cavenderia fasciculata TaxID=261658 RepID=F4PN56_CACFS|nr:uncharacterized protein DFA_05880 [Cavenderia fasciculata]EGG23746.1 hypothetical protein DFA_05880 [Cavenderia fasciculata]|eukprot:XP_004361597.1 hypothetical protein DFA_05880 [Cavenderia fasciculata]
MILFSVLLLVLSISQLGLVQSHQFSDVNNLASFTTRQQQQQQQFTIYVDYRSQCLYACGRNASQSFSNLKDAIDTVTESGVTSATIMVAPGIYSGVKNKELEISNGISLSISTINPARDDHMTENVQDLGKMDTMAVVNCQESGRAFLVKGPDTKFKLTGFVIYKCQQNVGGGVSVVQGATLTTVNTIFAHCKAATGAALYLGDDSTAHLTRSMVHASISQSTSDMVYVQSSRLHLQSTHLLCYGYPTHRIILNGPSSSLVSDQLSSIGTGVTVECGSASTENCRKPPSSIWFNCADAVTAVLGETALKAYQRIHPPSTDRACDNDTICNPINEDCFSCPHDCSCTYPNTSLVYEPQTPIPLTTRPHLMVEFAQIPASSTIKYGHLIFYAKPTSNENHLLIKATSCSIVLIVNGKRELIIVEGPSRNYKYLLRISNTSTASIFQVDFNCNPVNPNSSFSIKQKINNKYLNFESFYSINKCGDNIYNSNEANVNSKFYCPKDKGRGSTDLSNFDLQNVHPSCGDGACNEDSPHACPFDCFMELTKTCRELAPPTKIDPIYKTNELLGSLLNNQYLYALPGIDVFGHGVDILTGKSKDTRIFNFGYCEDEPFSTVHDLYRGLVYTIPYGLSGTPAPKCTYSSQSTFYETSSSIASEMAIKSGLSLSASASGGFWGYSVGASAAYSQDQSVQMASQHEQESEGSFIVSEVKCSTSKVILTESDIKLHHLFLRDLVQANSVEKMKAVMIKYGTAYIKSAVMGGTLKMVSIVSNYYASTTTQSELQANAELSLSVHASAPIGSVSASGSGSYDNSVSQESRQEFSSNSQHSTIITEGGSPGAFSPDKFGKNTFSSWAQSVDLRPVPIEPQLGLIYDLIPKTWAVYGGGLIHQLWRITEYLYYIEKTTGQPAPDYFMQIGNMSMTCYIILPYYQNPESLRWTTSIAGSGVLPPIQLNNGDTKTFWFYKTDSIELMEAPTYSYDLIDIVSSRVLTFSSGKKTPSVSDSESIEIRLQALQIIGGGGPFKIHVTVYGTKGSAQCIVTTGLVNVGFYVATIKPIQENNFNIIGDLTGIRFMLQPRARDPTTISVSIGNVNVIVNCIVAPLPVDIEGDLVCKPGQKFIYSSPNRNPIRLKYQPTNRQSFVYRNLATRLQYPLVLPSVQDAPIIEFGSDDDDLLNN